MGGKTLEGESLPLSPRTSPRTPPLTKRRFDSLSECGGVLGEVFCVPGGQNGVKSAASRPFGGRLEFGFIPSYPFGGWDMRSEARVSFTDFDLEMSASRKCNPAQKNVVL